MSQRFLEIEAMPNVHSHVFQRAMRGRAERVSPAARDDFWTWRKEMFAVADALTPESLTAIAQAGFAEMHAAGYGVVGEFHYVHHQPGGVPYEDPNALAHAVAQGAKAAGLPLVILPAAYHRDGWDGHDRPPVGWAAAVLRPGRRVLPGPRRGAARLGRGSTVDLRLGSRRTACGLCRPDWLRGHRPVLG